MRMAGAAGARKHRPRQPGAHMGLAAAMEKASEAQAALFARWAKSRAAEAKEQRAHEAAERAKDREAQLEMLRMLVPALTGTSDK